MAWITSDERMRGRFCPLWFRTLHVRFLLLLLCCVFPTAAGFAVQKLGADDVHDEQSVNDRLKVMTILQQLQAASMSKVALDDSNSGSETKMRHAGNSDVDRSFQDTSSTSSTAESGAEGPQGAPSDTASAASHGPTPLDTPHTQHEDTVTGFTNNNTADQRKHSENDESRFSEESEGNENLASTEGIRHSDVMMTNNTGWAERVKSENSIIRQRAVGQMDAGLLFEGDIMLSAGQAQHVLHVERKRRRRKVAFSEKKRWTLPIPYTFDLTEKYKLNSSEVEKVKVAIAHLESLTCITFREVNSSSSLRPILSFKKDAGCWSYVGKEHAFRFQEVSTGEGCFQFGTLLHELGHAIGFWHEHSRPDRKDFIRVHIDRVRFGEEYNFKTETWGELNNMDIPYDVSSIMHYGSTYFSRSGREVTVEALDSRLQRVLGQRQEMSFYDVKLANKAYCKDVCNGSAVTNKCQHEGYPDPKNCNRCRCPPGLSGATCQQEAMSKGVTCGGQMIVDQNQNYSISFNDSGRYPANVACTWLIRTNPGQQIVVNVSKENFMTHRYCSSYPTTVCSDYLEIKYNASFGYTGARYCCGLPPEGPLRSSGSSMLILFRTRHGGQGGFQAKVTAEPCGGCHPGGGPQPACRKMERRGCLQRWNSTKYVPCPVSHLSGAMSNCNIFVTEEQSRDSVCTKEVEYCCNGYTLSDGLCNATASSITTTTRPVSVTQQRANVPTGTSDIGQDADRTWSPWSSWQQCSKSCGGCGVQTRQRTCDIPIRCGGRSRDEQTRACNTFPCPQTLVYMCTKTRVKSYFCGWGKCYRRMTETGPCFRSECCPGYVEVAGKCVPVTR